MNKRYIIPGKQFLLRFGTMIAAGILLCVPALTQAQGLSFNNASLVPDTGTNSNDNEISAGRIYSFRFITFDPAPGYDSLPVVLGSFTAKKTGNQVLLNWSTDTEKDVSHFVIQKSLNGKDFTDAGILFTEGNSDVRKEYRFKDNLRNITSGLLYYRLIIVELNGRYKQSPVRIIRSV
jgi:hypothetical protein